MLYKSCVLVLSFIVGNSFGHKEGCCKNKNNRDIDPPSLANYDCSQLDNFGPERCNQVYDGKACNWEFGKKCHVEEALIKCSRFSYYEKHFGKSIDVGRCIGGCKNTEEKCKVKDYYYIKSGEIGDFKYDTFNDDGSYEEPDLKLSEEGQTDKYVRVIKSCDCSDCDVVKYGKTIEIEQGRCVGDCNQHRQKRCLAGVRDNFSTSNGLESSSPSSLLLNNYLSMCSAGVQNGFDQFVNDRCFGHTFTNCAINTECKIKSAYLDICLMAAQVPLTHTDSLALGFNGVIAWGKSMPSLNSGTWNPGDTLCMTMDLDNLPIDGASVLGNLDAIGHLDVAVQDDTAVDFLELTVNYEECEKCIPKAANHNALIVDSNIKYFRNVNECDCANLDSCERRDFYVTYYPGTILEKSINIGLCMGKCNSKNRCLPDETQDLNVISLDSDDRYSKVTKIISCKCKKLTWNGNAVLSRG